MSGRVTLLFVLAAVAAVALLLWTDVLGPGGLLSLDDARESGEDMPSYLEAEGDTAKGAPGLEALGRPGEGRAKSPAGRAADAPREDVAPTPVVVRFKGLVRGQDGAPAANTRVRLVAPGGTYEVETDGKGRFESDLPPGRYRVFLDGGDSGVLHLTALVVNGAFGAGEPVVFDMVAAASLDVTVLRLDDDPEKEQAPTLEPVPDAFVVVVNPEAPDLRKEARTGGQGVAVFEGLVPGTYNVEVRVGEGPLLRQVAQAKAEERMAVEVRVPQSVTWKGKVTSGKDGPGVSDAVIRLQLWDPLSGATQEIEFGTLYDGSFEVEVPRGQASEILVRASGHAPWPTGGNRRRAALIRLAGLRRSGPVTTAIALEPGIELAGAVQDENGRPLAAIDVMITPTSTPPVRATTDEAGGFVVRDLAPGYVSLSIATPGWYFRQGVASSLRLTSEMAPRHTHRALVLTRGRTLQGRVLDPLGKPLAGARVWLVGAGGLDLVASTEGAEPFETFSDGVGRWVLAEVPPTLGGIKLRATHGAQEAVPVRVSAGDDPIDLKLSATGVVVGTVTDQQTGAPVEDAVVSLQNTYALLGLGGKRAETDAAGAYRVTGVLPGTYMVTVARTDYRTRTLSDHVEVPATPPVLVDVMLDPGLVFGGTCVDEAGAPLFLAKLRIRGRTKNGAQTTPRVVNSDSDGGFHAGGFEPGTYEIRAMLSGYKTLVLGDLTRTDENLRLVLKKP